MRTRIAHLTADEVNHTLALRMAQEDREDGEWVVEPATLCALVRSLAYQAHRTLTRTPCAPLEEFD